MAKQPETKNEKFLRLMQARLGTTLENFRLIRQLSSRNYEFTPVQVQEVVYHLDQGIKTVAETYGVPYRSYIGADAKLASAPARTSGRINEIDVAKAIEMIEANAKDEAIHLLKQALRGDKR